MERDLKRQYCFVIVLLAAANLVCKKSPTPPADPGPPALLGLSSAAFTSPANAPPQVITQIASGTHDLSFVLQLFDAAKGFSTEGSHPAWHWRGPFLTYQLTVYGTRSGQENVSWEIRLDGQSGVPLNNWQAAKGTAQAEGKTAAFDIYSPNDTEGAAAQTECWHSAQNVLTLSTKKNNKKFDYTSHPDKSGGLLVKDQNARLLFETAWEAAGGGWWKQYDPITGQQTGGGSW